MLTPLGFAVATAAAALRENPLRTLLSVLGVIIGVAALVAVLSLGDTFQAFARAQVGRLTDVQSVSIQAVTGRWEDDRWVPAKAMPSLTLTDLADVLRAAPAAQAGMLSRSGRARVVWRRAGRERSASVQAVTSGESAFNGTPVTIGRMFTAGEADRNAAVVVLSHRLATELSQGRPEAMLGEAVRVGGSVREVVGILEPQPNERGYAVRVPYLAAASVLGSAAMADPPTLLLRARTVEDVARLRAEIEDWLAGRYRAWEARYEVVVSEQRLAQAEDAFRVLKAFLGALAGISMLVGGVGIMNIMLASVTERTREIGIRKAMGARERDIRLQFLAEAVVVSFVGSGAGVAVGMLLSVLVVVGLRAFTPATDIGFVISPWTVAVAAGIAVAIGLAFGTYPARRAGRLSPIDAIRHE